MQYVEPTDAERAAVRAYCIAHSSVAAENEPFAKQKRELAAKKKRLRDAILQRMLDDGAECCALPPAAESAPPQYVRVKQYSNQTAVTPELVADTLDELGFDGEGGAEALRGALLHAIKQRRQVTKSYADIGPSPPKGGVPPTVCSAELRQVCDEYRAVADELGELEKDLKERLAPLKEAVSREEGAVTAWM